MRWIVIAERGAVLVGHTGCRNGLAAKHPPIARSRWVQHPDSTAAVFGIHVCADHGNPERTTSNASYYQATTGARNWVEETR
jgi:hypothetical protein